MPNVCIIPKANHKLHLFAKRLILISVTFLFLFVMYLQLDSGINARPMVEVHAYLDQLVEVRIHWVQVVLQVRHRMEVEAVGHTEDDPLQEVLLVDRLVGRLDIHGVAVLPCLEAGRQGQADRAFLVEGP